MDHLLTTDMKITNTSTETITDVRIRTTVITAEAIEITTTIIKGEAIVTTEITIPMTVITETNMKKVVLNNIKAGVHSKERKILIFNLLDIIVHKIITSNRSSTIIIKAKAMGTTSELTWT